MAEEQKNQGMIVGEAAAPGIARGTAFVCTCGDPIVVARRAIREDEIKLELERFDAAISEAECQIMELEKSIHQSVG